MFVWSVDCLSIGVHMQNNKAYVFPKCVSSGPVSSNSGPSKRIAKSCFLLEFGRMASFGSAENHMLAKGGNLANLNNLPLAMQRLGKGWGWGGKLKVVSSHGVGGGVPGKVWRRMARGGVGN